MTKQELLDLIGSWENLDLIGQEIIKNPQYMKLLFEIALKSDHPKRWRAAWVADKINDKRPELIAPFVEMMIASLTADTASGIKRHILKLMSMHPLPEKYHAFLLDYCLQCLASAEEPVAVRVHAMQVLFNVSEDQPGFKPELLAILQHETETDSAPGIRSRGRKLAKQLHRQIRQSGIQFIGEPSD